MQYFRSVFAIFLFSISSAVMAADFPEFNGTYIKTNTGDFLELKNKWAAEVRFGGLNDMFGEPVKHVLDKNGMKTISKGKLKGFAVRGMKESMLRAFSIHPLKAMKLIRDTHRIVTRQNDVWYDQEFYFPGEQIALRSKAVGSDGYYFEPTESLAPGEYIAWIDETFWLFKVE